VDRDRVRSTRDIPGLVRTVIPRGTAGTVLEVRLYGTVLVRFDNGRTVGVYDGDLEAVYSGVSAP
jgi:hypothetical protein